MILLNILKLKPINKYELPEKVMLNVAMTERGIGDKYESFVA